MNSSSDAQPTKALSHHIDHHTSSCIQAYPPEHFQVTFRLLLVVCCLIFEVEGDVGEGVGQLGDEREFGEGGKEAAHERPGEP